jgi:transcriptional regulatory protein GAL4
LSRYLSSVEQRSAKLENLLSQLLPGIKIDDVLSSPELAKATLPAGGPSSTAPPSSTPNLEDDVRGQTSEPVLPEAVPSNADGFNWQEENVNVDGLTDGMAALSVEPTGVGYLGTNLLCFDHTLVLICFQVQRPG